MVTSTWLHAIAKFLTITQSPYPNIELGFYTPFSDRIVISPFRVSLHKRPFNYIKREPQLSDKMNRHVQNGWYGLVASDVTRSLGFIFGQLTEPSLMWVPDKA